MKPVNSAFEALGKPTPSPSSSAAPPISPDALFAKLVDAVSGDRKSPIPTWDGNPNGLRAWLKALSFWESDNVTPKAKWGLKLFQALSGDAKRLADTVEQTELLSERGYGAILTALLKKYKPYLEAVGPTSVDAFLFSGERLKGENFTNYIARKDVQKQELEVQIGAVMHPLIAGRILLKQAD